MSKAIIWRLAWKEYRLLRSFWITMLLGVLVGQLAVYMLAERTSDMRWLFLIAAGLMAFYALGCAATAFAGERESGTYELQRVFPVSPSELLAGKLLFAAISTFVFGLLACLLPTLYIYSAEVATSGLEQIPVAQIAVLGAFKSIELLAWGTLFSLLTARPLRAVVLAVVTTAVIAYPLAWLFGDIPAGERTLLYFPSFLGDMATLVPRACLIMVVVVADLALVQRWFRAQVPLRRAAN